MKAVITDLDRTLLQTDKTISEYTLEVLKRCRERGILVMAASARPFRDVLYFDGITKFDAITATNGAVISLPDGKLDFAIPRESGEEILSRILRYPDIFLSIETSKGLYSNRDIPIWQPVVYNDFPSLPEGAMLYKILVSSKCPDIYDSMEAVLTDDVYCTIADRELIQIMSRRATKWSGVNHMLSSFGISPVDAVYFGDDNDDIESIRGCGIGVAVSNAIPSVLAAADHITLSNDQDGVARFIEEHIL